MTTSSRSQRQLIWQAYGVRSDILACRNGQPPFALQIPDRTGLPCTLLEFPLKIRCSLTFPNLLFSV